MPRRRVRSPSPLARVGGCIPCAGRAGVLLSAHRRAARAIATVFVGATLGAVAFLAIVYPIAMLRRGRSATQTELPLDATQQPMRLPLVPFGVFLAPAAALMLIWGDRLLGRVFLVPY